jgi:hypothetical protein
LVSVSFAVDTSATPGFAYSSISAANGTITAIDAVTSIPLAAPVVNQTGSVIIDFSTITIPTAGQGPKEVKIRVTAADGTVRSVTVETQPGATKTQVRDAFRAALEASGFKATSSGDTGLLIEGTTGANPSQLKKVETFEFGASPPKLGTRVPGPDGTYPTYENKT